MRKQECSYILLQGIFLISVLFFALFVSSILFMFHISISSANLLLAILCSIAVTFYFSDKSVKKTAITAGVGLLIMAACMFMCMHFYDWSWDGNTYRKARTGLLKYGWNPIYETFFDFQEKISLPGMEVPRSRAWFDTSPKASEIIAASFYEITNDIEAGKCFTLLSVIALFCICYSFLDWTNKLKKWHSAICSLFCVINTVIVGQCVTNYHDAFLYVVFLLCFVAVIYLTFYDKQKYSLLSWYFIFISINIGFNIKLSMPLFLAIFCLSMFVYWLITKAKEVGVYNSFIYYKKHFCLFAISVLSGLLVTGSTFYLSNYFHYHNPLGGSTTGGISDEITNQLPLAYKNLSHLQRFVCSLFSKTNSSTELDFIEWKIPLTFTKSEFLAAQRVDVRTGGWGIFFSAIFLISICVIFLFLIRKQGLNKKIKFVTVYLLLILGFSISVIPGLSWARYDVFVFLIPVAALLFIFMNIDNFVNKKRTMQIVARILIMLLLLNLSPNIVKNYQLLQEYSTIHSQLLEFKNITEENDVVVSIGGGRYFFGRLFSLYDKGITNFQFGDVDGAHCTGKLFLDWGRVYYDVILEDDSSDIKETTGDYINKNRDYILIIAVKDEGSKNLSSELVQAMKELGLDFDLADHYRWSYLAVVDAGDVIYENMSEEKLEHTLEIAGNTIDMQSAGYDNGNMASIKINGLEYALNQRGLNIVVYDKEADCVIDSVRIDTHKDNTMNR